MPVICGKFIAKLSATCGALKVLLKAMDSDGDRVNSHDEFVAYEYFRTSESSSKEKLYSILIPLIYSKHNCLKARCM
jgi:hypothetical protein